MTTKTKERKQHKYDEQEGYFNDGNVRIRIRIRVNNSGLYSEDEYNEWG